MAAINQQFKLNKLAKDLGLKSKDLVEILSQNGIEAKTTQKALEPAEFDVLFDTLTRSNQIKNISNYLDGITQIPSKVKKPAPAEEKPAAEKQTAEKEAVAPTKTENVKKPTAEKVSAEKAHAPKQEAAEAKPVESAKPAVTKKEQPAKAEVSKKEEPAEAES
jgi:hypothetical protein